MKEVKEEMKNIFRKISGVLVKHGPGMALFSMKRRSASIYDVFASQKQEKV